MAVQNPFFGGRRDNNDNSASKFLGGSSSSSSGSTLPTTAAGSASSVLGGNLASKSEETSTPTPNTNYTSTVTTDTTATTGSKLTVGPNIKLKGVEITDCDTLVVEGTVEATMDSRVIQIAAEGAFRGSAEIDIAEIHGEFEGNLTVRDKLVIFGSGRVHGKIRYGKVIIEEGGQLTGEIECSNSTRKSGIGAAVSNAAAKVEKAVESLV